MYKYTAMIINVLTMSCVVQIGLSVRSSVILMVLKHGNWLIQNFHICISTTRMLDEAVSSIYIVLSSSL